MTTHTNYRIIARFSLDKDTGSAVRNAVLQKHLSQAGLVNTTTGAWESTASSITDIQMQLNLVLEELAQLTVDPLHPMTSPPQPQAVASHRTQGEVASGRHGPCAEQLEPLGGLLLRTSWANGGKMPPLLEAALASKLAWPGGGEPPHSVCHGTARHAAMANQAKDRR